MGTSGPAFAALFSADGLDLAAELKRAEGDGRHLAVYFELPDCSGCRDMKQHVFSERRAERDFGRQFRTVRVDLAATGAIVDTDSKRITPVALAQRLRIVGTPAFAFFGSNGALNYRHVGSLPVPDDFVSLGRFVSEAAYENEPFAEYRRRNGSALHADTSPLARQLAGQQKLDFELRDQHGRLRRLADFRGQAVALTVGYTHCPDVCPTTLAELMVAVNALGSDARHVQVLFATIDPERDTQKMLGAYVAAFRPDFLALRGNPLQTADFIRRFSLVAEKQPSASQGYTVDHTAGVFLFDRNGRLRGVSPYGQPLNLLTEDLKSLAAESHRHAPQLSKR
ncbi:SCO family protein [Propionivibrio sp.]|uniref:SCO family protein n=1 Tax=Propionivibrio sp. TaxID=2212460 RepID=UPI003BF19D31